MKFSVAALSASIFQAALFSAGAQASTPAPALVYHPEDGQEIDDETMSGITDFLSSLAPLQGDIELPSAEATLVVPESHYFLGKDDAQAVLTDAWGNPPDESVLGMLFPAGVSPLDADVWGATVSFNDDGYISDKDAAKINYDKMMTDLQESQEDENIWRLQNGYPQVEIIGWAEPPVYNAQTHKLYWAKDLKFGDGPVDTLNYDIRVLGRKGALVISFISSMPQLEEIREAAPAVLEMASFDPGATYEEFAPGVDKKAAYGIAGLIGGVAIAKKTGILAAILIFGKKFIAFILVGLASAFGAMKRFFAKKA